MTSSTKIDRAKTALSRNNFSRPVQHLLEMGLLTKKQTFFDYGCGRGDDIAGLLDLGFRASGWDPAYRGDSERINSDVVNIGFVLNVIESPAERADALKAAWNLTRGVLMVTVISVWERPKDGLSEFADGHVTQRGTFQKYYEPGELKEYVDAILEVDSIPSSPTAVLCFRDSDLEQEYLLRSHERSAIAIPPPTHPLRKARLSHCLESFRQEQPDRWNDLVDAVTRGAAPPSSALLSRYPEIIDCGAQARDILSAVVDSYSEGEWEAHSEMVRERLIAQIALAFFRGKPKAKHFPPVERDAVKYHFGSFADGLQLARSVLFTIGNPDRIARECYQAPVGLEDEQALYVHRSGVPYLSAPLQTYIGVGRLFYGDLSDVDVFKIHKASGKLTLLLYEDFENTEEPILQTRVKVDFPARRINYYDHRREQQALKNKIELMP
jgi:DNA phosphorothioation-associated putative methyltransferase